jgi:hypothetical protein
MPDIFWNFKEKILFCPLFRTEGSLGGQGTAGRGGFAPSHPSTEHKKSGEPVLPASLCMNQRSLSNERKWEREIPLSHKELVTAPTADRSISRD